jgi:poly(hydroxyalkanoate) depolymerase family esterase
MRLHSAAAGNQRPFTRGVDARTITRTIQDALSAAGPGVPTALTRSITETIERAFASAGLGGGASQTAAEAIEGEARHVPDDGEPTEADAKAPGERPPAPAGRGQFVTRSFTNAAGTRAYRLYVPAGHDAGSDVAAPLVVMLHGCTQSPDDFAAGTRMNALADQHGFLVAYPEQAANANGSRCWNWFRAGDQQRDHGEPSIIAGIAREVAAGHRVDTRRIFVAGLSAGAAMAIVLGVTYPELFAAVGAHSGLPYGAAHDMPSAFAAMRGGNGTAYAPLAARAPAASRAARLLVPVIVFHGDSDATVAPRNGAAIVEQSMAPGGLRAQAVHHAGSATSRRCTQTVHTDAGGAAVIEHWVVHGAGHAWFGGSPDGSYTDPHGPDASAEMIRFFMSRLRAGTA